jgi:uncharacterized membrane protein YfcA
MEGQGVTLLLVAAIVALGAFLQSASGFGFSLIAVPIISILVGAKVAVVGMSTLGPLLTLSLAATGRRHVRVSVVRIVTLAAIVGMPVGLWVLTHVGDRLLAILIASVVIGLTLLLFAGVTASDRTGIDVAAGFTSGVLATSTGTNGPPLVLALQARRVPPSEFRATLSAAFLLQSGFALLGFALARQFTAEVARVVAVGVPGLLVGRLVGDRFFAAMDQRRFRGVVLGLLMASGVFSLADALLGSG